MNSYTTLKVGSSGEAVKRLQEKLGIETDGQYGSQTKAAVEDYQRKNGLQVDGIAGTETQGHMFGNGGGSTADRSAQIPAAVSAGTQMNAGAPMQAPSYRYDASQDTVYQEALQKLKDAQGKAPVYAGTYDQQLADIYQKIMNREPFSYDLNGDALWHQYKDQAVHQGNMAMMDTMGQAAALTGGYGNTYAQQVGQQTYQGYLQNLNDKVPELYQLARSMYDAEGDRLAQQYAMTGDLAADEYGKYQDQMSWHQQDLDRAQTAVNTAYSQGESSWLTEQQLKRQDEETAYGRAQDSYDRLVNLITSTGYAPSQEELAAAGMSAGEAAAYAKYYAEKRAVVSVEPETVAPDWGGGIDTTRNTGKGGLKGSGWDYSKNNLSRLLASGDISAADKYMEQILDELSEEQFDELITLYASYGYGYE